MCGHFQIDPYQLPLKLRSPSDSKSLHIMKTMKLKIKKIKNKIKKTKAKKKLLYINFPTH